MPIKFRQPQDINAIRFGATLVWGIIRGIINGVTTTVTGASPLALVNALAKPIKKLVQYGKCTTIDDEIYCNNGKLVAVDDELPIGYKRITGIKFDGDFWYETGEVLTGDDNVTMTLANTASSGQNVFGSYNGTGSGTKNFSLYIYGGGSSSNCYFRYGSQLVRPRFGSNEHTITFGHDGTSGFDVDVNVTPDEFTTIASAYIGMLPNSSSAAYSGSIMGNITVGTRLKWIPCERESDGTVGYYEAVSGVFLEPSGTGVPVKGNYDTSHLNVLSVDGTPEVLTIGTQTASVVNLFSTGTVHDEQNIISGTVTRRCEAVISDGTAPSGRYIGTVGEGNIIVKARETGYEGDIVTFDADRVAPLNGLTVNVEPIQDLHGYDAPWPDGGGKNKFDSSLMANAVEATKYITLNLKPNTEYTMSTDDPSKDNGTYADLFFCNIGESTNSRINGVKLNQPITRTSDENGNLRVWYRRYKTWITPEELIAFHTQVEEGSTATAWTPCSNICPISGWTAANVTRTGKNLIPSIDDTAFWDTPGFFNKNGTITERTNYKTSTYLPVIGGCQYVFSTFNENKTTVSGWKGLLVYDSNKQPLQDTFYENNATKIAITIPDEGSYIKMYTVVANNITYQQLELGATSTTYEPYTSNTYTIQLGETVYGGTLDVTAGTLTVTQISTTVPTNAIVSDWWSADSNQTSIGFYSNANNWVNSTSLPEPSEGGGIFSYCKTGTVYNNDNWWTAEFLFISGKFNRFEIRIPKNVLADISTATYAKNSAKEYLAANPLQVAYSIAPQTYQLNPATVQMLLGENNLWADTGTVKAYIPDAELIEHVTPQPMHTEEGNNTVSVTSNVDPVQLEIDYYKDE